MVRPVFVWFLCSATTEAIDLPGLWIGYMCAMSQNGELCESKKYSLRLLEINCIRSGSNNMKVLLAINMPRGVRPTIRTNKPRVLPSICKCTESIVLNASSNTRWPGKIWKMFSVNRLMGIYIINFLAAVDACILPVRNVNSSFAMVAISHSKWVPNVVCPITVPNWVCIHIIQETVYFTWEIRNRMSYKNYSRYVSSSVPSNTPTPIESFCCNSQMNKIEFNIEPLERLRDEDYGEASARARARKLCPMPVQKETPTGLVDTVCNGDVNDNSAGLCR